MALWSIVEYRFDKSSSIKSEYPLSSSFPIVATAASPFDDDDDDDDDDEEVVVSSSPCFNSFNRINSFRRSSLPPDVPPSIWVVSMVIYRVDNSSIMEYTSSHVPSSLAVVVEVGEDDDDDDDDGVADSSTATLFFILLSFCFSTTAIYFARNVAALTAKSSSRLLLLRAVAVVALPPFVVVVVVVVVVGVSRVGLDTSPIFFINTRRWAFFINHIAGGSTSSTFGECIELSLGTVSYPSLSMMQSSIVNRGRRVWAGELRATTRLPWLPWRHCHHCCSSTTKTTTTEFIALVCWSMIPSSRRCCMLLLRICYFGHSQDNVQFFYAVLLYEVENTGAWPRRLSRYYFGGWRSSRRRRGTCINRGGRLSCPSAPPKTNNTITVKFVTQTEIQLSYQ